MFEGNPPPPNLGQTIPFPAKGDCIYSIYVSAFITAVFMEQKFCKILHKTYDIYY